MTGYSGGTAWKTGRTHAHAHIHTDRHKHRHTRTDTRKYTETETDTNKHIGGRRETLTNTCKQSNERETDRQTETERETERERPTGCSELLPLFSNQLLNHAVRICCSIPRSPPR